MNQPEVAERAINSSWVHINVIFGVGRAVNSLAIRAMHVAVTVVDARRVLAT